jgi:hypothetical protein
VRPLLKACICKGLIHLQRQRFHIYFCSYKVDYNLTYKLWLSSLMCYMYIRFMILVVVNYFKLRRGIFPSAAPVTIPHRLGAFNLDWYNALLLDRVWFEVLTVRSDQGYWFARL